MTEKKLLRILWLFLFVGSLVACLTACHTVQPSVAGYAGEHTDGGEKAVEKVYVHDSIVVHDTERVYVKGDTVFVDRWHEREKERRVVVHDTLTAWRDTTITVTVRETERVEVPRKLTWGQKALMRMGWLAVAGVAAGAYTGLRVVRKRRKL